MLEPRSAGIERSEQIDIDDGLEPVRRHSERGRGEVSRRPTHDQIDLAMSLARRFYGGRKGVVVADIGGGTGRGAHGHPSLPRPCIAVFFSSPPSLSPRAAPP